MSRLTLAAVVLLAASALAAAPPTLTGHWAVHTNVMGYLNDQDCTFVQTGHKLTGSCDGQDGTVAVTGTVNGDKLTWQYDSTYNGSPLTMQFSATLGTSNSISGSVAVSPYGVYGDFTAAPVKPAPKTS